ncbi:response regulator transcription factor [Pusillimonas sp. SM2304]|uniref:response regulator transcription factor n=1 Tax=Pusillimonas sp. SM2304 TaxID=3073241 RepID=UPI0028771253|nr:response regulator transcription factor [Pusillimonas sp. SM2304]MDS1140545.1 response regulator transcription factor [Pusillimonas sp. SM2304]
MNKDSAYYSAYSILVVEDDAPLAGNLLTALEMEGFLADVVYDGDMAIHALAERTFDLLVLDIGLPGKDGYHVLAYLRETLKSTVPVIFLTARGSLEDKKVGFTVGADDYLTKPFALDELVYRIKALMRRADNASGFLSELCYGALRMSVRNQQVWIHGKEVRLPKKGMQILELLLRQPGRLISRESLERALWRHEIPNSDALRSQVHILRRMLAEHGFTGIETVSGSGWRLGEGA